VERLKGGRNEVRVSLLGSGNEEGLVQLQELWGKRMTGLEALVLSTKSGLPHLRRKGRGRTEDWSRTVWRIPLS
jgi:hypothetical protein